MRYLKQSTAVTVQAGPAVDKTDGVTAETALTPTIFLSKEGAAQAARSSAGAITHDRDGYYRIPIDTTDTNTLGHLLLQFSDAATHLPVLEHFIVVTANVWDSLFGADKLEVDLLQVNGTANVDGASFINFLKRMGAVLLGKTSGRGTASETHRDISDARNAVVTALDGSNNRTALTFTD